MPYAEVKRAIEQEAQVQTTAARSASPYRLSPREVNKASPQPDMNAARYSVPPGKCLFWYHSTVWSLKDGLLLLSAVSNYSLSAL